MVFKTRENFGRWSGVHYSTKPTAFSLHRIWWDHSNSPNNANFNPSKKICFNSWIAGSTKSIPFFFMSHVWFRTVISGGNWPKSCILFCFCKRKETNFEVSQKFLKTMICKKFMNLTNYRWVKLLTFYHSIVANQLITHCESGNAVPVVALGRPLVIADDGSGHLNPVEILFI